MKCHLAVVAAVVSGVKRRVFVAADEVTEAALRKADYALGEVLSCTIVKPRNRENWRRAHKLGQLLIENVADFENYTDAHDVIKRLQLETGVCCDETAIRVPNYGIVMHRVPQSMAFDLMEDEDFNKLYAGFAQHIVSTYWPGLGPDEIEQMASLVGMAA